MKSSVFYALRVVLFAGLITGFAASYAVAQNANPTAVDSTEAQPVNMADISSDSFETILELKQLRGRLIKDKELQLMKLETDSLVSLVDSLLDRDMKKDIGNISMRELDNKLIYWNQQKSILGKDVDGIKSVLHDLNDARSTLKIEESLWHRRMELANDQSMSEIDKQPIDNTLLAIDTTLLIVNEKRKTAQGLFNNSLSLEVEIETWIARIENETIDKQHQLFKTTQKSLFTLDYTDKNSWSLTPSFSRFLHVDLKNLRDYLLANMGALLFHIILIVVLIWLFIKLGKADFKVGKSKGAFYTKRFKILLSRPISVALMIGIFASVIIYPNRPLIFIDMMRFFVVFPIVLVLVGILRRRYHIYVYALGIVLIIQIIYINLEPGYIISRIILLSIALIEGLAILHFILFYRRRSYKKYGFAKTVLILCYVHLAMAVIGLIGNVIGKVALGEFMLFSVSGNALVATIIALSLVVVNGLLVLFINSKYTEKVNVIRQNRILIIQKIIRVFNIAAIVLLIYYILMIAGWETAVVKGISDWFTDERSIGDMKFSWWKLVVFFLVIWLSIVGSKIIRAVLEVDVLNKMKLEKGLPHTIAMMVRYTLVTVGIFLAVSAAGLPFSEFAIIFGAFGVGIGFGLQNIFNNLVSGFILLFERPIKINDTIEVGTLMGNVRSIGIRASNVRTFDGAEIIVPNGNLISNEVINWTLSDQTRRIEVIVGVSYSSDPHQVQEILLNVLNNHKDVVSDPAPNVFFRELGESSLDFRMLCWTPNFDQWIRTKSEIIFNVFDELKAANIEIPFPQRDLHVRSVDGGVEFKTGNKTKE